ncbi:unnamed protein product [Ectocarpus sp. 13 AM-2016]
MLPMETPNLGSDVGAEQQRDRCTATNNIRCCVWMGISAAPRTKPVFRYVHLNCGSSSYFVPPTTRDASLNLLPRGGRCGVGVRRRTAHSVRYRAAKAWRWPRCFWYMKVRDNTFVQSSTKQAPTCGTCLDDTNSTRLPVAACSDAVHKHHHRDSCSGQYILLLL